MRALIIWRDQVLLVRNVADHDRWTLPGGGPKVNETYEQALQRELSEELRIFPAIHDLDFIRHYDKTEVGESYDKVCYRLDITSSDIRKMALSAELLQAKWFSIDHLPTRLSRVVKLAIRDHQSAARV